ncbi:ZYRO0C10120p [Zygosaccharomyces rouxii]|uniref:ZYRO0C10120p n=1 Tax=Zygosaccharomyces rouxii (strain ATCC 2623 / CBS 732 / NBRC 1130 / NCYC 568 / NRRL Y-229) TaxID=559307 RepID=C5DTP0_ZYGRC|nr:uncharacterized protein ZYRO0C10120g [Zygosaccharomyces rouxii]CAR27151.1 ZYRO0C10120p [Zygosaccharomyces rouxii]
MLKLTALKKSISNTPTDVMIFKNKFKKPDADALKNEASDAAKDAKKDPQQTLDQAKDLSKKNPLGKNAADGGSGADGAAAEGFEDEAVGAAGGATSPQVARGGSRRTAPAQDVGDNYDYDRDYDRGYRDGVARAGRDMNAGTGGHAEDTTQQHGGQPQQMAASPRRQGSARQAQTDRHQHHDGHGFSTAGLAGAEGGVGDPEDEFETSPEHSEYVPASQYGTPASPRRNAPAGAPTGAYDPAEGEYVSGTGATHSPKKTPSGAYRPAQTTTSGVPSRSASRKKSAEDGGVAGGGATSGAGGYGYDYPDYQDRSEWDRRHSKKGFSMPFRRHHEAPEGEAEEIGGATGAGAGAGAGAVGGGRSAQAPARAGSRGRGTAPTGGAAGKDSAAVAGAGAAVQRAGGTSGGGGVGAGTGTGTGLGTGTGTGTEAGTGAADASGGGGTSKVSGFSSKLKGLVSNKHVQGKASDLTSKAGIPKNVKEIPGVKSGIGKVADTAGIPGGATGAGYAVSGAGAALGSGLSKKVGGKKGSTTGSGEGYEGDGAGGYTGGTDAGERGYGTGGAGERGYGTGERGYDTGEHDYGTGQRGYGTGERGYGAGERGYDTGEHDYGTGERGYGAGEHGYDTGEHDYGAGQRGYGTGERGYDTGEHDYGAGQRGYGTGERGYDTGEHDYGTGQRGYGTGERGYGTGGYGVSSPKYSGQGVRDADNLVTSPSGKSFDYDRIDGEYPEGSHRYSHRGPATATSASKRSPSSGEHNESRTASHGHSYDENYQGGYEAGYLAGRRGEVPQGVASPARDTTSRGGAATTSPRGAGGNVPHGAGTTSSRGADTTSPRRTASSKDYSRGATGLTGAAGAGAASADGGIGHGKGYGAETDPAGGFSRTAGLADDSPTGPSDNIPDSGPSGGGYHYGNRDTGAASDSAVGAGAGAHKAGAGSESKTNPFKQDKPGNDLEYDGTGAERYGAHDPSYSPEGDRSGGNLGGTEAYGYGRGSYPADKFADDGFGSGGADRGAGKRSAKPSGYGHGDVSHAGGPYTGANRQTGTGKQFNRDAAGYGKSPASAVGPGSEEYPEDYDDVRNPGADELGTRRGGGSKGTTDRGATGGGLSGLAAGGAGATAAGGFGGADASKGASGGGLGGGISKVSDKAGGPEKIKGSLDKAANSKAGGITKSKAGDLAKSKLGEGKAGELAGKAKGVPGANDAASKAQGAVGKGISSKFGGGSGGGATGAAGALGAGGALAGAAGGQKGADQGDTPAGHDGGDYRGYGYDQGVSRGGAGGGAYDDEFDTGHYGDHTGGGAARRTGAGTGYDGYDTGNYGGTASGTRGSDGYDEGYQSGMRDVRRGDSVRKPAHDDAAGYAPKSSDRSYGRTPEQDRYPADTYGGGGYGQNPNQGGGDYGRGAVPQEYPPDYMVGSEGGTNRRLRQGLGGEGEDQKKEQLGVSDGDQVPTSQEVGDQRGDGFAREASADSSAYYDSSETVRGSKEQAPTTTEKPTKGGSISKTKQPAMRGPVDAKKQDTSIPRLGFQGLFSRKKSVGGTSGGEEAAPASTSKRGSFVRRLSLSRKKSADQEPLDEPFNPETENNEPVTRTKSDKLAGAAASPPSTKKNMEPSSPRSRESAGSNIKGSPRGEKQAATSQPRGATGGGVGPVSSSGEPTTGEGKRFAETFGNMPSLVDSRVPTYGWGTYSEGPPTGPADSAGGVGSGKGGNPPVQGTAKPDNLPVMSKDPTSPKYGGADGAATKVKKSSSYPQRNPDEDVFYGNEGMEREGEDNYVTSRKPTHGKNVSVGSHEMNNDAAADATYGERGYYNRSRTAPGLREEEEPTSIYGDEEGGYNINEASKVPRGGPDEAEEVAQGAKKTADAGKGEPGIFEKIKNTIMPGSHEDAGTAA